jgi:hypothetical protein
MRLSKSLVAVSSGLVLGCAVFFSAAPALAYVACNRDGDCWHTGSKTLDWSAVTLKYHDDDWWDAHKGDAQYHFHDTDAQHNWEQGYWSKGEWRRGF